MLNNLVLVGRLVNDPTIEELEGKKIGKITLAVQRAFKNVDGIYETDYIDCVLWSGIAENTAEYCRKGDVVGVKGRMVKLSSDEELKVIAEKVTFLTSKKKDDESE